MSDAEYVAAVKGRLDTVIQAAINWLNAQERKPWSSEDEQRCVKATRACVEELKPLIGSRLIQLAQKYAHPDPNCFGVPLVNALHALAWRDGPRSSLRSIQDCYHYLINLSVVVSGSTESAVSERDRTPYDPHQRQPETLGELERWMYADAAGGIMKPPVIHLHTPPVPGLDRLDSYCKAKYLRNLSIETVRGLIGEYALARDISAQEARAASIQETANALAPKAPAKHLDDRQRTVVAGSAAPSPLLQPPDNWDRNSRTSAVEPLPAEDLPLWEKLQAALAGLAGCMKSRPDLPLGRATDFHHRIADSLKDVGAALRAVGLQDCMDDWDCPRGHGSYARNLLQFTRDPTPEVVGRLLSQDAREPAFLDLMRRDIVQFAERLLAATKPTSSSLLHFNPVAPLPERPAAEDINAAIEQAGLGPFLDKLGAVIAQALASRPSLPVPQELRRIAGGGPVTATHIMAYLTHVCRIPPSEQLLLTHRQKHALLEAGVRVERELAGRAADEPGETSADGTIPQQTTADLPNGPFGTDGFRYRKKEVRFGRAAKQRALLLALWDEENLRPRDPRPVQDVLDAVYGEDHDTDDAAFRQLCADTRSRFEKSAVPLTIETVQGRIQLIPRPQ